MEILFNVGEILANWRINLGNVGNIFFVPER